MGGRVTPSNLATIIRERYNATGDSFFSDTYIYNLIYQAEMELALEANVIENSYTTVSVSGTREYAYPDNAISIRRVEYKGVKVVPRELIDDPKTSLTEPSGTPAEYAIWDNELILFPTPDTDDDQIKVFSYDMPSEVSATSTLSTPAQYHLSLIHFCISNMHAKELNDKMASYHMSLWRDEIRRIKRERKRSKHGDMYAVVRDEADIPAHPGVLF